MDIERIYLDQSVEEKPLSQKILQRLEGIPVEIVKDRDRFIESMQSIPLTLGKRKLWLTHFKGPFVKRCPGTDQNYLCCNYWVINQQTNCPLDCTYCVLQSYLTFPLITIYVNMEQLGGEIDSLLQKEPNRLFRIGTGELTDSLALNPFTEFNQELIQCASTKNFILEFKTKTDFVGHLPPLTGKKNVVVSWSLNADTVIREEEFKTAPLEARLEAAERAISKGYRVGFHFDPIIETAEWERKYGETIDKLSETFSENDILWLSIGSLRYPPALKNVVDIRFPHSRVTTGEMVRGLDGKMRYLRPIRTEMYQKIYSRIRKHWKNVFVYFCMENETVWKEVTGFAPEDNNHLDYLFHENLFRRFPDLQLSEPKRRDYATN
ncbi:MAG: hypothetical protein HY447_03660 [Candidatus Omnitrophica bacterium]|nr:hypothetical protein [Candidatus Omnitrophota bacterium]